MNGRLWPRHNTSSPHTDAVSPQWLWAGDFRHRQTLNGGDTSKEVAVQDFKRENVRFAPCLVIIQGLQGRFFPEWEWGDRFLKLLSHLSELRSDYPFCSWDDSEE